MGQLSVRQGGILLKIVSKQLNKGHHWKKFQKQHFLWNVGHMVTWSDHVVIGGDPTMQKGVTTDQAVSFILRWDQQI